MDDHVSNSREDQGDNTAESPWFLRALPMTALLLLLVALTWLLVPGFRDQAAESTTRQSQPFAEVYFPQDRTGAPVVCTPVGDSVRVRFTVASHLEQRQWLRYRVTMSPGQHRAGNFLVSPGESRHPSVRFPRPAGPAEVTVRLPELRQHLHARCAPRGTTR